MNTLTAPFQGWVGVPENVILTFCVTKLGMEVSPYNQEYS